MQVQCCTNSHTHAFASANPILKYVTKKKSFGENSGGAKESIRKNTSVHGLTHALAAPFTVCRQLLAERVSSEDPDCHDWARKKFLEKSRGIFKIKNFSGGIFCQSAIDRPATTNYQFGDVSCSVHRDHLRLYIATCGYDVAVILFK